jgi:hypothetical protein
MSSGRAVDAITVLLLDFPNRVTGSSWHLFRIFDDTSNVSENGRSACGLDVWQIFCVGFSCDGESEIYENEIFFCVNAIFGVNEIFVVNEIFGESEIGDGSVTIVESEISCETVTSVSSRGAPFFG